MPKIEPIPYAYPTRFERLAATAEEPKNMLLISYRFSGEIVHDFRSALEAKRREEIWDKVTPQTDTNGLVVIEYAHYPLPANIADPKIKSFASTFPVRVCKVMGFFMVTSYSFLSAFSPASQSTYLIPGIWGIKAEEFLGAMPVVLLGAGWMALGILSARGMVLSTQALLTNSPAQRDQELFGDSWTMVAEHVRKVCDELSERSASNLE